MKISRVLAASFLLFASALLVIWPAHAGQAEEAKSTAKAAGSSETAVFAAGCFWCVEKDFDTIKGVLETTSGYTGGSLANPTYEDVGSKTTGHVEAVRVRFDPKVVTYKQLLDFYWLHVDPTDGTGQFCDRGPSYRPVIFVAGEGQRSLADASKKDLAVSGRLSRPIAVAIEAAGSFWPAEIEHQDYYKKNPLRYRTYRAGCGRDARLAQLWGSSYGH